MSTRTEVLDFTHLGRRVLVFPVSTSDVDEPNLMLAVEGSLYGPFSHRRDALMTAHRLIDRQALPLAS